MVRIEDFYIDRCPYPGIVGEQPMVNVSWYEAKKLCEKQGKRLCTNEEWDKSCHGPFDFVSPFSPSYNKPKCELEFGLLPEEVRIGSYKNCVSDYGVYDMSGNLWEWTAGGDYATPLLPMVQFKNKVIATWLWYYNFLGTRCNSRGEYAPKHYFSNYTFRCCKDPETKKEESHDNLPADPTSEINQLRGDQ